MLKRVFHENKQFIIGAVIISVILVAVGAFILGRNTAIPTISDATPSSNNDNGVLYGNSDASSSLSPAEMESTFRKHHPIPNAQKIPAVTAEALYQLFSNNEVQATQLYLNKYLKVTGRVVQVTSNHADLFGDGAAYIWLYSEDPNSSEGVYCDLSASAMARAASIAHGDSITVQGYAQTTEYGHFLTLSYCTVL